MALDADATIVRGRIGVAACGPREPLVQSSDAAIEPAAAMVDASARSFALELGIGKNTAQRALTTPRTAHLVEPLRRRTGFGRFDAAAYRPAIPVGVLSRALRHASPPPQESSGRLAAERKTAAAVQLRRQLVLLLS